MKINETYKSIKLTAPYDLAETFYDLLVFLENEMRFPSITIYDEVGLGSYRIKRESFPKQEQGKPYVSYYKLTKDHEDECTYFNTFEELFLNYKTKDGVLFIDIITKPEYKHRFCW